MRDPPVRKSYPESKNFAMSNVTAVLPGKIEDIINVLLLGKYLRIKNNPQ